MIRLQIMVKVNCLRLFKHYVQHTPVLAAGDVAWAGPSKPGARVVQKPQQDDRHGNQQSGEQHGKKPHLPLMRRRGPLAFHDGNLLGAKETHKFLGQKPAQNRGEE